MAGFVDLLVGALSGPLLQKAQDLWEIHRGELRDKKYEKFYQTFAAHFIDSQKGIHRKRAKIFFTKLTVYEGVYFYLTSLTHDDASISEAARQTLRTQANQARIAENKEISSSKLLERFLDEHVKELGRGVDKNLVPHLARIYEKLNELAPGPSSDKSIAKPFVPGQPRDPGTLPPIWNVPFNRNPEFTGREALLAALYDSLSSGEAAAITQPSAIHGLGGIGKTQIALEFAYRYMAEYEIIWWVKSETRQALTGDYAALAVKLGIKPAEAELDVQAAAARQWLGEKNPKWLLIFDNVNQASEILNFLPQAGNGHTIITTRSPSWKGVARPLTVDVLERNEAVKYLTTSTGQQERDDANALAELLGDLPLALAQAAAYMVNREHSFRDYVDLFSESRAEMMKRGKLSTKYPESVATTWVVAFDAIRGQMPVAADFFNLCAFFAPDNISVDLFLKQKELLPNELASALSDRLMLDDLLALLRRYGLMTQKGRQVSVHRLVQAVARDRLDQDDLHSFFRAAMQVIKNATLSGEGESDPSDHRSWPRYELVVAHGLQLCEHAEALGLELESAGLMLNQIARNLKSRAAFNDAEDLFKRALKINGNVLGPRHLITAATCNNLAGLFMEMSNYAEAEPLYRRALKINVSVLGTKHPNTAFALNNLAGLLTLQGNYAEAEQLHRRALKIYENVLGPKHPNTATALSYLALVFNSQGNYAEAEKLHRRALKIYENVLGPKHPNTATALDHLAHLLMSQDNYSDAEQLHRRALKIYENVLGPEHPNTATTLSCLAIMLELQGGYNEAESLLRRSLQIYENVLGPEHPNTATTLNYLAIILESQGGYTEAEPLYKRALEILENALGPEHPDTKMVAENHQVVLVKLSAAKK